LAGDEDYGVAAEHSLEKDGLWAILAWINILEFRRTIVNRLMKYHWQRYGRSVFARYEFDKIDEAACRQVLDKLEDRVSEHSFIGKVFTIQSVKKGRMNTTETLSLVKEELYASFNQEKPENDNSDVVKQFVKYEVADTEIFQYEDPFDGSTTVKEVNLK
jgi:phosphoglucomutase